jgi:methyl-accepting chemotaxis protein
MYFTKIPSLYSILNFFRKSLSEEQFLSFWNVQNGCSRLISRSSWSLELISRFKNKKPCNIYVPSYFCNYALKQIRQNNILSFYPVKNDFTIDLEFLRKNSKNIDILILVNYYGKTLINNEIYQFCKINKIWLVEDNTHVFLPKKKEFNGDFQLYSPYKFLPIPLGAVLTLNSSGPNNLHEDLLLNEINWKENLKQINKDFKNITKSNLIFSMLVELDKNNFLINPILNKTSVFESDLIRSVLDNKVDKSEDTETTIRRVHGIVNFMRMDDYGYPTTLKETDFVDIVTSPSNLRNMASATIDIKSILSSGMLVAILNDVKLTRSSEKEFASLIDNAKTYIDKVQKSNKEIDLKKKEISDVVKKIKRIVDTVGNVHALSPSSDNFVDALLEIDMNSNKSPYYEDLVGIPAKIVKNYFVEHFPLSILDLYLIRARQTGQIEKFESEYAKDDFFFLPSDILK